MANKIKRTFWWVVCGLAGTLASLFVIFRCVFSFGGGRFYDAWKTGAGELEPKLLALDAADAGKALDRSFSLLNILDTKATGLLSVNGLLAAFLTVFIAFYKDPARSDGSHLVLTLASGQLFILIVSALFCFAIVRMNWEFLRDIKVGSDKKVDATDELKAVCIVVGERTFMFQFAWWLTLISLFVLLILACIYVTT